MSFVETPLDPLTYKVNGLAMQVQNELKPGHREKMYQRRLTERLLEAGLQAEMEKRVEVYVNDTLIGYMFLDIWVEQALVVECKAFSHHLDEANVGQVVTYLAATGAPVGMLYNFGRSSLEWKRILPPKNVQEWHQHLYRCIWTPPGTTLPPIETLTHETPIRFSVFAQPASAIIPPRSRSASETSVVYASSEAPAFTPDESVSPPPNESVPDESVSPPPNESVSPPPNESVPNESVSIRLSASYPVDESASHSLLDPFPITYASAGVNIDVGNRAVELMGHAVRSTYGPQVLAGLGAFGGLYDAAVLKDLSAPVLVASTDGVGTKVKLAAQTRRYDLVGQDLVNHCVNDILVQGARPLFFLDYVASSKIDSAMVAKAVGGMAAACRAAGCALLGGETAEMPGVYADHEFDLVGTIVGVVERAKMLPRQNLQAGDLLVGLRSSGPHTNGYSLIRRVFKDVPLDTVLPDLGMPLADMLLAPHRSYLPVLQPALDNPASPIKALIHITGGGLLENIPRVLPPNLGAIIRRDSWRVPSLFQLIQQRGRIPIEEMYRVFNMGIGMVAVVAPENLGALQEMMGEVTDLIGKLVAGEKKVTLQ